MFCSLFQRTQCAVSRYRYACVLVWFSLGREQCTEYETLTPQDPQQVPCSVCFAICFVRVLLCFTICLFICPDLDGNRGTTKMCPERPTKVSKPKYEADMFHDMFVHLSGLRREPRHWYKKRMCPERPTKGPETQIRSHRLMFASSHLPYYVFTICLFISPDLDGSY
jgi:hypothetical protein